MSGMIDVFVPAEQEGTRAVVRGWLKQVGEAVALDDPLVELETDKVTQEVSSPGAGVLAEILIASDGEAVPGALLGRIRMGEATRLDTVSVAVSVAKEIVSNQQHESRLSPSVKRAVRVHNIDPSAIAGSGRGGRLTRADVDAFVAAGAGTSESGVTSVPHDRMRLAIAANMLKSVSVAPHVTAMFECDFSAIIAHRAAHKAAFEAAGANLTFTAYFIAASAAAMGVAPAVNSRWYDDRLELYDSVNVGVGTALGEKGLVVPVIRDAQAKSLIEIARLLGDVTVRARAGKLSPADLKGGTFTISNHGVSGSLFATPIIIAQPQSAILGIGKTEKRVVVREVGGVDAIQVRPMAYVSLTIDHRVVDGHQTNGWLAKFVETIENWPIAS
ncbi:dihydrolipoamide acetyltransferase family protein [Sphingomonas sp. RB1R13]|uniref:dihydrolipoamide acetyltransferase family protein n=1 Tax=Sphingomonas sp. RB1R13 TaxID=3096159 RepID=UPI002FC5EF82